ncbi:hypothetical protein GCM10025777_38270 [Membranihabitans marinus]|uniref:Uncharacterized protein n=1 Tax=Nesterenkonia rhizosphaerae TaxID=1348272 RepID=A0ABP9G0Q9_9MICC
MMDRSAGDLIRAFEERGLRAARAHRPDSQSIPEEIREKLGHRVLKGKEGSRDRDDARPSQARMTRS